MRQVAKISIVINTLNEEKNIARCINSVKKMGEIVVCDMHSDDNTVKIAKSLGAKVFSHKRLSYVEPARNYAIGKATNEWILILDPDEEISAGLTKIVKGILRGDRRASSDVAGGADYYRIPRKNIIFGKWLKHTLWWPDYQIRLFRKGSVLWQDEIHSFPLTSGTGADLPAKEKYAIVHYNYNSLSQYLEKMSRYTRVTSEQLLKGGYVFNWKDLITKPLNEFLRRFFEGDGYKDGVHGLALSLLQAFSELVIYINVWEKQGFKKKELKNVEVKDEIVKSVKDVKWWVNKKLSWLKFLPFR